MPIDYSKWDKIEISDDSDIEVHPNVDKNSFIRWKQRDIHEKRFQRNIEIKSILVQLTTYEKINQRVDYLLEKLGAKEIVDNSLVMSALNSKFDRNDKFDYEKLIQGEGSNLRKGLKDLHFEKEEIENTPPYNEMVEDLFTQIKDDHPATKTDGDKLIGFLKEHRAKIDDVLANQTKKLDDLLYQKSQLIVSDDLHTGFDRSFLNKDKPQQEEEEQKVAPAPSKKTTVTTTETINSPKTVEETPSVQDMMDELTLLPATEQFAEIPINDYSKASDFLIKHPSICTEQQKDALMMSAFDHQLSGDSEKARHVIFQALLLQYIAQLSGSSTDKARVINTVRLFFSKISDKSSPAHNAFMDEVKKTADHIKARCEIIKQERELSNEGEDGDEEEALIQLRALDDKTELVIFKSLSKSSRLMK
ncbi:Hsp90 co-chaperone, putative (Cell division control protein, putative) [Candida maltosa Xu316]|uniref:Hsp90 co-chaperone, putative (Cell division control protein, putative) n=1 Tax=Candida maltosa (strain Xu316) TaxID=1245528 RepID=M3HRN4_CANMX|nr:Hsp90 co-chaperone, putative (Cell division control protein, putative) [Candida maltosa Xu316]